jgi:hypothetical protein
MKRIVLIVILSSGLLGFEAVASSGRDERNIEALLKYLRPVLKPVDGAARIYYVGTCNQKGDQSAFPRLNLQAPSSGAVGLAAVRQIVQNDKTVTVSKDRSGMIRINIGKLASPLLQTRIRSIKLTPDQQYTDWLAIGAIEESKEVDAARTPGEKAFEKLGGGEVVVCSILVQSPVEGFPHVPARMRDVTLDQALDSVAKTFGAIVIYSEWRGPHGALHSYIDFKPVVGYSP